MSDKWPWLSYGIACLAVSVAVCFGLYMTHSAWCLCGLLFLPDIHTRNDDADNKKIDKR